ncbi:GMC oxidoreductase [Weeksellaceae bacterium KMM 9724]|uniref:GMC family oxidoreductase N-terminal domain-containing protein n=1 Tax=Profundicola chukchiensis TaxID=2961959 RepID=UPI002440A8F9|nr:GMC oxidoreductase [Profundicola chukchiensis]MDG4950543.1 GMC oxidoreductase [Profundicola chukchiensis]
MTRKEFLKKLGLGAFGLVIGRSMIGKALAAPIYQNGGNFPIIIIGTGYGSAVSAERLAQAGHQVLMLEMGLDWDGYKQQNPGFKFPKMTSPSKQSTWMNTKPQAPIELGNMANFDKFTGILERVDYDHIKIYQGKGVGGGSLVNGGMTVTPDRNYFKQVFEDVGVNFTEQELDDFFNVYFPRANTNVGRQVAPQDVVDSEWYKFARVGIQEGVAAGFTPVDVPNLYDFEHMRQEIAGNAPRSATNIEVLYGNNHGKQDLTKTYIKRALNTGNVTILPQHKVDHIIENYDGTFTLKVQQIDTLNRDVCIKEFTCEKLFVGAGSLGTTELLQKSKYLGKLKKLNDEVGKYWGNNGNVMASRRSNADFFGHTSRGANQSTMPIRGLDNFNDPVYPFFAEIAPMPTLGSLTSLYLIVNKLKRFGKLSYDGYRRKLQLEWDARHTAHMRTNAEYFLNQMNEHGSKSNFGSKFINNTTFFPNNGVDESICYHPLGGVVLGKATDMFGRLKGYSNLYVMDGSLIPGTLGVNPYVSITAIAERNIEHIINHDF